MLCVTVGVYKLKHEENIMKVHTLYNVYKGEQCEHSKTCYSYKTERQSLIEWIILCINVHKERLKKHKIKHLKTQNI